MLVTAHNTALQQGFVHVETSGWGGSPLVQIEVFTSGQKRPNIVGWYLMHTDSEHVVVAEWFVKAAFTNHKEIPVFSISKKAPNPSKP